MKKEHKTNINGAPEHLHQESLEGLGSPEVCNLNNEVQQSAPNDAEEINRLSEKVSSETSAEPIQQYKDAVRNALKREYLEFLYSQSMGSWKSWAYVGYLRRELNLTDEQARRKRRSTTSFATMLIRAIGTSS